MTDYIAVLVFVVCTGVIFFAGGRLARYGDRIAELSGWGGAWVGLILMASVTSLPELMVGISSAAVVGSADLAVGDVLGSCAINLLILAGLDAFAPQRRPLFSQASPTHVLAAALGIALLATVGFGLLSGEALLLTPWIGVSSVAFLAIYLASVRLIHRHSAGTRGQAGPTLLDEAGANGAPSAATGLSLRRAWARYAFFGGVVVAAAVLLPPAAEAVARLSGLQESFVGTVFLALSTSLPELAVSLAAVRRGSVDLAVGNIFGSNLFNILILALDDLAYVRGPLLADASPSHLLTVLATIAMSAVAIIGLTYRTARKRFVLAWDAAAILAIYLANAGVLYAIQ